MIRLWHLTPSTRSMKTELHFILVSRATAPRFDLIKSYLMDRPTFPSTTSPFRASSIHTPPRSCSSGFALLQCDMASRLSFIYCRLELFRQYSDDMNQRLPFQVPWRTAGSISCCDDVSIVHGSAYFEHDDNSPRLNSVAGSQLR